MSYKKLTLKLGFYYRNKCCSPFSLRKRLIQATFLSILDYGDFMHACQSVFSENAEFSIPCSTKICKKIFLCTIVGWSIGLFFFINPHYLNGLLTYVFSWLLKSPPGIVIFNHIGKSCMIFPERDVSSVRVPLKLLHPHPGINHRVI